MNIGDHVVVLSHGRQTTRTGVVIRVAFDGTIFVEMDNEGVTDHGHRITSNIESFAAKRLKVVRQRYGGSHDPLHDGELRNVYGTVNHG